MLIALAAVAVAHALSPLIFRGMHSGLGWDETVYVSQISKHTPSMPWAPERARA